MLALGSQEVLTGKNIFKKVILFLGGTFFLAKILLLSFWTQYLPTLYPLLELFCLFVSFTIFLLVWYTYEYNFANNCLICFCFLTLGLFDGLHFFFSFQEVNWIQINLATWYWLWGRFTLAFFIVALFTEMQFNCNKYTGLIFSFLLVGLVAISFYKCRVFLPLLNGPQGYTLPKIIIGCTLIGLYSLVLYLTHREGRLCKLFGYQYLVSGLFIVIAAEICFLLRFSSFFYIWGYILQITYYFLFLKGVFVLLAQYPYEKIAQTSESVIRVFDEIPLGIVLYDQETRLFFANKKALHVLNCQLAEICGLHHDEVVQKLGLLNILKEKTAEQTVFKDVYVQLKKKTGSFCKVKADYYKLPERYLVLFEEVAENQELEILKLQTKTILNSVNKVVILLDEAKQIVMCNKKCLQVLEIEEKQVIGCQIEELQKILNLKETVNFNRKKEKKTGWELHEISIVTPLGNKKELFFHLDEIHNLVGEKIGAIILATDITWFKKENIKIQQKEKLIALGQMAAGIVHEIKNPLTAIKGFGQLINYQEPPEKIQEYALMIIQEAETIDRFISDFLTFAKPAPPDLKKVSLNKIIKSMRLMIDSNTFLRDIEVSFDFSVADKLVIADAHQLKQVILNIFKNALEAIAESEGSEIKISTVYQEYAQEMSVIIFNDGKAMSDEEKMLVGTPFFTTKAKGTGLGLSICFQIIKEHEGRIEIESEVGVGTSFIIYLPCLV